ncbi:unnamed protein product, partial [Symbiodinium natans]
MHPSGIAAMLRTGARRFSSANVKPLTGRAQNRSCGTFFIGVQDRCMYSHTFHFSGSEPFTTGCTAVVQVKVFGRSLGEGDVLMDISVGQQLLREIMMRYDHKNLDMLEEFQNPRRNTTVEVMAEAVHRQFLSGLKQHLAEEAAQGKALGSISKVEVVVKESDVAFAGFAADVDVTSLGPECMTSVRYRSLSNVSEADADSKGEAAAQLSVWGERLLAEARSSTACQRVQTDTDDAESGGAQEVDSLAIAEEAPIERCQAVERRRIDCMCGIPAPSYSRGPKFPRACDAGLLEALPATGSSWSLPNMFGNGAMHWFSSSSSSRRSQRKPLRGKVVFWGNLHE